MEKKFEPIVNYIITFLTGIEDSSGKISYSKEPDLNVPITIINSGFFDEGIYLTESSMPSLPLANWKGIPLLFGDDKEVDLQGHFVIYADIIASSYFLLSRYEECINRSCRDKHGRFLGKFSLPYRAGFIERPIIDEYGQQLRLIMSNRGMGVNFRKEGISHVYLTHDVDEIWQWDSVTNAFKTFIKRLIFNQPHKLESILSLFDYKTNDSIYTFPYFIDKYHYLEQKLYQGSITEIYFIKGGGDSVYDNKYYKNTKRIADLIGFLKKNEAQIGLHASYSAGKNPALIKAEKKYIELISKELIFCNRNHYLESREPEDMEYLIQAGISSDFSMGYADVAGFRLGTCQAIKWINPVKRELTKLTLHPLTVMDCTLNQKEYMNLDYERAFEVVKALLAKIYSYNGEVILLWHNNSVSLTNGGYQKKLYDSIIQLLFEKMRIEGRSDL